MIVLILLQQALLDVMAATAESTFRSLSVQLSLTQGVKVHVCKVQRHLGEAPVGVCTCRLAGLAVLCAVW